MNTEWCLCLVWKGNVPLKTQSGRRRDKATTKGTSGAVNCEKGKKLADWRLQSIKTSQTDAACQLSAIEKYLCQYLFNLNTFITYSLHIIQCFLTSGNLSISPRESMFWLQIEFIWQTSEWGLEFPLHFKVPGTHYRDWFKSPAIDHKAMEAALGYRSPGIYLSSVNYRG